MMDDDNLHVMTFGDTSDSDDSSDSDELGCEPLE